MIGEPGEFEMNVSARDADTRGTGPVVVEIEGVTEPATFFELLDALSELLTEVEALRVWDPHRQFIESCIAGADARENIARRLEQDGRWSETLYVGDVPNTAPHRITIRPAAPGVAR